MNPQACPHCATKVELPDAARESQTLDCPHCGTVLRIGAPTARAVGPPLLYRLRLLTLKEAGAAHHEIMARLLITRASLRGEPAWTCDALSILLTLHGHLVALAGSDGTAELIDNAQGFVSAELINAVERVLLAAELHLNGLRPHTDDEEPTNDDA